MTMTTDEAQKIVSILCTADSGCPHCARDLIYQFIKSFPQFEAVAIQGYLDAFKEDLPPEDAW